HLPAALALSTARPPPQLPPLPLTTLFRSGPGRRPPAAPGRRRPDQRLRQGGLHPRAPRLGGGRRPGGRPAHAGRPHSRSRLPQRSEEHTSELQSLTNIVCRLLLEKKKTTD